MLCLQRHQRETLIPWQRGKYTRGRHHHKLGCHNRNISTSKNHQKKRKDVVVAAANNRWQHMSYVVYNRWQNCRGSISMSKNHTKRAGAVVAAINRWQHVKSMFTKDGSTVGAADNRWNSWMLLLTTGGSTFYVYERWQH